MHLKRLDPASEADRQLTAQLACDSADYRLQTYGRLPVAQDGHLLFDGFPPGCAPENRLVLAAYDKEILVGLAQIARAYPTPDTAYIGLLLVNPAQRRRHHGCRIVEHLSQKARSWPGILRWQLSVLDTNINAISFWRHCGFNTISAARKEQGLGAGGCVMERTLKARPACRGGKLERDSNHLQARHLFSTLGR